jgi:hypothetical protein
VVTADYVVTEGDYYVGVSSKGPVTVKLPAPTHGRQIVVKLEMPAPIGTRKVTVDGDGALIDDSATVVLKNPYDSLWVIARDDNWHIL